MWVMCVPHTRKQVRVILLMVKIDSNRIAQQHRQQHQHTRKHFFYIIACDKKKICVCIAIWIRGFNTLKCCMRNAATYTPAKLGTIQFSVNLYVLCCVVFACVMCVYVIWHLLGLCCTVDRCMCKWIWCTMHMRLSLQLQLLQTAVNITREG